MPNVQNLTANDHKDLMNIVRQFITGYGTFPTPGYVGTGDGTISDVASPPPSLSETWTITCNLGGGSGTATFTVSGSVSGAQSDATVGEFYDGAGGLIEFLIKDGPVDFIITDVFTVVITEGAMITSGEEWSQDRWVPHPNDIITGTNFDIPTNVFNGSALSTDSATRAGQTTAIAQAQFDDAVEFDQYTIMPQGVGFVLANTPLDWTLEWSDDLANAWTVEDTQVGIAAWVSGTPMNFALTSPGRHFNWRVVITNNNGGTDVDIGFIEARVTGDLDSYLSEGHLLVTGQGLAAADVIPVGMAILEDPFTPYFNWRLQGAIAFDDAEPFQNQPGGSPQNGGAYYVLDDGTVTYWIVATGRYFIVVTKIGTVYTSMMMGFHLPYGAPVEYSFPLVIAGSGTNLTGDPFHFTLDDNRFRMFANPGANAMLVRDPAGTWLFFTNFLNAGVNQFQATDRVIAPYAGTFTTQTTLMMDKVVEAIDGSYPLTPLVICEFEDDDGEVGRNGNAYGELDGVFHISGSNQTSENTLTISGDDYIVFQDIARLEFQNFMAVRLDT